MEYVEILRTRRSLLWGSCFVGVALLINVLIFYGSGLHGMHVRPAPIPVTIVWAIASVVASVYASALGCSLSCENEEHLPVAWTKPASREQYAIKKMGVDLGASALMFAVSGTAVLLYLTLTGMVASLTAPTDSWGEFLRYFIAPAAFYGLMQALTATLRRGAGMVIGFTWAALFILIALGSAPLAQPYHAIFAFLNFANPLNYVAFGVDDSGAFNAFGVPGATLGLSVIALSAAGSAIYRWKRLEA